MLKNLLVHIPSERPIRPVVDSAISLAVNSSAHLDAVSIGFESTNIGLAVDGAAAVAAVFDLERERALARANAALAVFETEARNAGIAYRCQALTAIPVEAFATLGASFADRISVLVAGRLLVEGAPEQVARDARVKAVYLGEATN